MDSDSYIYRSFDVEINNNISNECGEEYNCDYFRDTLNNVDKLIFIEELEKLPLLNLSENNKNLKQIIINNNIIFTIDKLPIKCYTYFIFNKDIDPLLIKKNFFNIFKDLGHNPKNLMSMYSFKCILKNTNFNSYYDDNISIIFQIFEGTKRDKYIVILRRLCGDIIEFNKKYRQISRIITSKDFPLYNNLQLNS